MRKSSSSFSETASSFSSHHPELVITTQTAYVHIHTSHDLHSMCLPTVPPQRASILHPTKPSVSRCQEQSTCKKRLLGSTTSITAVRYVMCECVFISSADSNGTHWPAGKRSTLSRNVSDECQFRRKVWHTVQQLVHTHSAFLMFDCRYCRLRYQPFLGWEHQRQ